MSVDQYSCFRKTPSSREKKSFFRESFATPSPRPFVCSVRSGAIVTAAVMLANTVAAVHLRAVRSVKCEQSPSFALATCACRRCGNLATSSLAFRRSFADLSPNLLQNSPANVIDLHHSQHRQEINTASVGAAYLPIYKGAGSANMKCTGMPPRIQRGIFREQIIFFRELHRRSFAEEFTPR